MFFIHFKVLVSRLANNYYIAGRKWTRLVSAFREKQSIIYISLFPFSMEVDVCWSFITLGYTYNDGGPELWVWWCFGQCGLCCGKDGWPEETWSAANSITNQTSRPDAFTPATITQSITVAFNKSPSNSIDLLSNSFTPNDSRRDPLVSVSWICFVN